MKTKRMVGFDVHHGKHMPLFTDGNETSFLFWGLKITIFMWFECFILTAIPTELKQLHSLWSF
ncbi:MAG: hypothetical protein AAFR83_26865, partial [Cyanobacteria bacterium J06629_18]